MKTKLLAMIGAVATIGFAAHASAAVYTVTYTGTVVPADSNATDTDVEDLFGGGNLTGDAFTAVYTYNTSLGTETATSTTDQLVGGLDYGVTAPITSVTFTINGDAYTYTPDYDSIAYASNTSATKTTGDYVEEQAYSTAGDVSLMKLASLSAPKTLSTAFTGTGSTTANYLDTAFVNGQDDVIGFTATSATVAAVAVSAAPEPSTWMLMIAGVGMIGLALRRRRTSWGRALAA
jgi:hypothetical protein